MYRHATVGFILDFSQFGCHEWSYTLSRHFSHLCRSAPSYCERLYWTISWQCYLWFKLSCAGSVSQLATWQYRKYWENTLQNHCKMTPTRASWLGIGGKGSNLGNDLGFLRMTWDFRKILSRIHKNIVFGLEYPNTCQHTVENVSDRSPCAFMEECYIMKHERSSVLDNQLCKIVSVPAGSWLSTGM